MFCRIEFLERDRPEAKAHVVSARYGSAANLIEMMLFAERERRVRGAGGYRLHNLHTDEVQEIWD